MMSYSNTLNVCTSTRERIYLCKDVKKTLESRKASFFFLLLISFDNSLSGGIVGLVIGSAICGSSLSVSCLALCCHDHYAVCNNGELCCLLLTLRSQVKRTRPIILSSLVSENEQRAAVGAAAHNVQ